MAEFLLQRFDEVGAFYGGPCLPSGHDVPALFLWVFLDSRQPFVRAAEGVGRGDSGVEVKGFAESELRANEVTAR